MVYQKFPYRDKIPERTSKIMKSTGIVRRIDSLGRFVLPSEIRRAMDVDGVDAALEIFVEDDKIVMKKYSPRCIFCGSTEDLFSFEGKMVCPQCAEKMAKLSH